MDCQKQIKIMHHFPVSYPQKLRHIIHGAAICYIYQLLEKQVISTLVDYCIPCISNPFLKKKKIFWVLALVIC